MYQGSSFIGFSISALSEVVGADPVDCACTGAFNAWLAGSQCTDAN
jgi:hypothetical protein